jgi:fructose-1,6-bisphosphatase I
MGKDSGKVRSKFALSIFDYLQISLTSPLSLSESEPIRCKLTMRLINKLIPYSTPMSTEAITLDRHLWQQQALLNTPVELSLLLIQIGYTAKIMSREISRAALVGQLGLVGEKNATGDAQKKLDVFSNQTVIEAFSNTGLVAALVSEELDQPQYLDCSNSTPYILCIDPLDGSSNIDSAGALGTIFGVYRRVTQEGCCNLEHDLLRQGHEMVAAGYILYGTSTVLVYTCGCGVDCFTLDTSLGEFLLSQADIRCPVEGKYYSANLSYIQDWRPQIQSFIQYLNCGQADKPPYSLRYSGALVSDVHRNLVEGGIYFYPPTKCHPNGKLRLLYECAPLAFVLEQAGGKATTGSQRVLDIQAASIHQRSPLVIGSMALVELYEQFLQSDRLT